MSFDERVVGTELQKETHEFIRFMLRDHAFSEEFLVTAIQEYFQSNKPKGENQCNLINKE